MEFFLRAYKNYANFQGRDTRQEYWMFYVFYVITYIGLLVIDIVIFGTIALSGLFALASIVPSFAIATRRLHDVDKSGWWQLILLIPLIGPIVLIIFLAKKGTFGANRFGGDMSNTGLPAE